jgi:hypothetical protein
MTLERRAIVAWAQFETPWAAAPPAPPPHLSYEGEGGGVPLGANGRAAGSFEFGGRAAAPFEGVGGG